MSGDLGRALQSGVLVCDGDVGAAAVLRGATQRAAAEAAVTDPERLIALYLEYRAAGANLLQSNTACASGAHLERLGSSLEPADVLSSAMRLCREAAAGAFVAAVIGPPPTNSGEWAEADLHALYRRQLEVLLECGPDTILFRGFQDPAHLSAALGATPSHTTPEVLTVAVGSGGDAPDPQALARSVVSVAGRGSPAAVGATGTEAAALVPLLCALREATNLPLVAQWGRGAPEHAGRQAAELIAAGARIVGGAAGMPPGGVAAIAKAARALA